MKHLLSIMLLAASMIIGSASATDAHKKHINPANPAVLLGSEPKHDRQSELQNAQTSSLDATRENKSIMNKVQTDREIKKVIMPFVAGIGFGYLVLYLLNQSSH